MKKHLQKLLLLAALLLPWVTQAQVTLPYSTGFESGDDINWTFVNDATNAWCIGAAAHNSGTAGLYISNDNGTSNAYTVSATRFSYAYRDFTVSATGQYAVSFDWKANGEGNYDYLRAWIAPTTASLTAGNDPEGGTSAYNYRESTPSGWIDLGGKMNLQTSWQTTVATPSLAAGTYRLVFMWANDASSGSTPPAAIDNVIIAELSCPQPTALSAFPSADQIALSWTPGGTETTWMVVINDSLVDYTTTTTYTAINLTPNTPYICKVYSICGVGDTSFAAVATTRTSCVPIGQLPYSNDFENEPYYLSGTTPYADAFPNCWTRINDATGTYNYYPYINTSATYLIHGGKSMYWYHSTSTSYADNEYAVLPPVDLDVYDISDLTLSFYAKTTATAAPYPQFIVGVMTNPSDQTTFVPLDTITLTTTPTLYAVSLQNYTGTGAYIAIHSPRTSTSTAKYASLDDIYLTDEWCDIPLNVTASVSTEELTVSWNANGGSSFTVVLGEDTVSGITDTSYTFTGLTPNTAYSYAVATECGSALSSFISGSTRTACDLINTLPYSNDFENEPYYLSGTTPYADAFPNCWTRINDATGTYNYYPYINTSATYLIHGGKSMYWYHASSSTYANNQYAVLPPIDLTVYDISDLTLSFYAKTTATAAPYPQFIVGVMTNPSDQTTFVPLDTITLTTTPTLYTVSLQNYTGTGAYIAIHSPRTSTSTAKYASLDDIYLTDEWCDVPANVTASADVDEIAITWDNPESSSFTVVLGDDTVSGVYDSSYTFTGLTPNTPYNYAVAAECSSSLSSFINGSIRTECVLLDSMPYTYGFEDLSTSSSTTHLVIPCWHHLNNATQYFGYPYVSSTAHNSSRSLYWYACTTAGTYGDYQIAVLPGIDTDVYPINTLQLTFWARPSSTSYSPVFYVGVMSDPNDPNTFQQVATVNVQNVTDWQEFNTSFAAFTGYGNYIAVRVNRPSSNWYAYTDDFTISELPDCPPVTSVRVRATASAARLTWSYDANIGNPNGFVVSYRYADDTNATPTTVSTSNPELALTGLDPDTAYWVSVAVDCGGLTGEAFSTNFSTAALPCIEWDTTGNASAGPADTIVVGNPGTSTTNVMPVNTDYNYSYCQHLILASELTTTGPQNFSGIGFDYAYSQPMTHATNCQIYMGNTTRSSFAVTAGSSSDSMFVPYSDLTLVYQGPLNCTTNGYNFFLFNQGNFMYDGTSNIVVAIVNNSGATNSSAVFRYQVFSSSTGGTAMSHRVYNNATPYGPTEMDAARAGQSYWRSNMKLVTGGGGDCLTLASCMAPAVNIEQNMDGDYVLSWIPGYQESSWDVDYRPADTTGWINAVSGTTSTDYTFLMSDLQPNTDYEFRVTALCSDTNISTSVNITTPCTPFPVPFTESFDTWSSTAADPLPNCWAKHTNYTTNYPNASTTYHHSGTKSMYMYSTTTTYSYMVLPQFALPIDSTMVSFWLYKSNTSYAHNLLVGVMTNPDDVSTFTEVASVAPTASAAWELFEVSLNTYSGTGRYIAIMSPNGVYSYPYLDDLTVDRIAACPRVENLRATYAALDSITIAWDDTSSNSAWYVEYDTVPLTPGDMASASIYVTDTFYTFDNLDSATTYYFYVYPDCSEGVYYRSITAATLASSPATVPYVCNFEDSGNNGWDLINTGQNNYWIIDSAVSNGGSRSLYVTDNGFANSYSGAASYAFATRTFSLTEVGEYAYSFDWKCNGESSYDFIRAALVPVSTQITAGDYSGFDNTSAVPAGGIALDGGGRLNLQTSWQTHSGTFTLTTPGTYKWVFLWRNDGSVYNVPPAAIDNVSMVLNTCPAPQNVTSTYVSGDTIALTWIAGGDETMWEVSYDSGSFVVYDTSFIADNLSPNTLYNFRVRAICGYDDSSIFTSYSVRTACGAISSLPFFEDFEGYATGSSTSNVFIPCWGHLNNGTSSYGYPYVSSTTTYNHTPDGSRGLYWYNSTTSGSYGSYQYIILPMIDTVALPINTLQLVFWAKATGTSYNPDLQVGVMQNAADTAFQLVQTVNVGNSAEWTEYTVDLGSFTGYGQYVAIRATVPTSTWSAAVDDIKLNARPACSRVENLHVTYVALDSITVVWEDTSNNVAWYVEYDTVDFIPGTGVATPMFSLDTTYTLSGLDSGTTYHIYVYPDCNGEVAERYVAATTLAASPATVPFVCDFEAEGVNGWDLYTEGQTNYWMVGNATGNTGRSLYVTNNGTTNDYTNSVISYSYAVRNFHLTDSGDYAYSFDWKCNGEGSYDFIRVLFVPAAMNVSAGSLPFGTSAYNFGQTEAPDPWIDLTGRTTTPYGLNMQTTWQNRTGVMHIGTPGTYKMVIAWANDGSGGTTPPGAVDNFTLVRNTCAMPQNVTAELSSDSITLHWTPGGAETSWEVTLGNTSVVVSSTDYTFTGLAANTEYTISIRSICGAGDSSLLYTESYQTPCVAVQLPYSENFDSITTSNAAATGAHVNCWDYIMTGTSTYQTGSYLPQVYYSSTYAHSGSYSYRLYGQGYHMLPPMPTSLDSLQLTFWDYTTSTSYGLEVGVMEGNDFVPVQTISTPTSTHMQHTVYFGSYTGNSRIIAFRNYYTTSTTTYYSYHYIDDVEVEYLPTCPPVVSLAEVSTTTNSMTINWVDQVTAPSWQVEYTGNGSTGSTIVTSHPATIVGLSPATSYQVRVRPICSATDTGHWCAPVNIPTGCDVIMPPYSQDFNAVTATTYNTAGVLPPCWDAYSNGTSALYTPHVVGSGSYWYASSGNSLVMTSGSASYGDTKFVRLPQFATPVNTLTLSFWMSTESSSNGFLLVGYMTDTSFSSFVTVDSIHASSSTYHGSSSGTSAQGYRDTVDFASAPASALYLAFKWVYTTSFYSCCIDDVEVTSSTYIPVCHAPVLTGETHTYNQATVNWAGDGNAYEIAVKETAAGAWPAETAVAGMTYTFTGLTPATEYTFRVRQDCDTIGYSDWTYGTFTTDSLPCMAPTNVAASDITNHEATITWTPSGNETAWEVNIFASGQLDTTLYATATTVTVDGLTSNTTYSVMVRALCGDDHSVYGDWSVPAQFTTVACPTVTNLHTTAIQPTTISVAWNAVQMAEGYELEYGVAGFTPGSAQGTVVEISGTSYTIENLQPMQVYDIYVTAVCGDNWYSEEAATLTNVQTPDIEDDQFVVTVTSNNPAWGTVTGSGVYTAGTQVTLTATPTDAALYRFVEWSDGVTDNPRVITVTENITLVGNFAQVTGIESIEGVSFNLYPNPAKSSTTVSILGMSGKVRIAVVDVNGREVIGETIECSADCEKRMDIDGLTQGAYFVRVTGEQGTIVRKLMVK